MPFRIHLPKKDGLRFSFVSIGPLRLTQKLIIYDRLSKTNDVYNLALVDVYNDGSLDDLSVSDNHDMPRILATVIQSMHIFFDHYPDATVIFAGSSQGRTRLYRIAISQNLALFDFI